MFITKLDISITIVYHWIKSCYEKMLQRNVTKALHIRKRDMGSTCEFSSQWNVRKHVMQQKCILALKYIKKGLMFKICIKMKFLLFKIKWCGRFISYQLELTDMNC